MDNIAEQRKQCIEKYNKDLFERLKPGDLIKVKRNLVFCHWMVYIGDGYVVHVTGEDAARYGGSGSFTGLMNGYKTSMVVEEDIWSVLNNDQMLLDNELDKTCKPFADYEIVRRALGKIGMIDYHPALKNCEHFAKWCRYDVQNSNQSRNVLFGAAIGGFLVGGPIGALFTGAAAVAKLFYDEVQHQTE